jgi:regulator of protease activity HflC (stomatin/prohibitin superfamily)
MSLFTVTVPARHCAVAHRHGVLEQALPAGRHPRRLGRRLTLVDLREQLLQVSPQEVLTDDGVQVRVSAVVRWSVVDPVAFVEHATDPLGAVYLATQVAIRDGLAALTVDDLTSRGARLPVAELTGAVAVVARQVGVGVAEVVVRDVIVPHEVRAATLELVTARTRGAAQLEAARAETAALRSLANGARLLEDHPALARIRLVQAVPPGSRVVVGLGVASAGED